MKILVTTLAASIAAFVQAPALAAGVDCSCLLANSSEAKIGVVSQTSGKVYINTASGYSLVKGVQDFGKGSEIVVGSRSAAKVSFLGGCSIEAKENSTITTVAGKNGSICVNQASLTAEGSDSLYGNTTNPDGTPKTVEIAPDGSSTITSTSGLDSNVPGLNIAQKQLLAIGTATGLAVGAGIIIANEVNDDNNPGVGNGNPVSN